MQSLSQAMPASSAALPQQRRQVVRRSAAVQPIQAFFGRKGNTAVVEREAPPAPKRGLGGLSWTTKPATAAPAKPAKQQPAKQQPARKQVKQQPAGKKVTDKAAEYEKRQSFLGRAVSALDFAEVRSKSDAELLYEAKYGQRGEDGKMSRAQYQALRRKIGGTAKDYWKGWVDVKGEYTDKGYVSSDEDITSSSVPALPFLIAVVVGLFGATFFVVAQTS